jgi:D-ribose pyranose/furanose isomerase RbsD
MATYLQGVTDYIPQFQPFQPDLNFYGNIMQTKQTQYDTNWKALNKMYGQYYHADLTRDDNIAKKDNYLNQIEFNLQRVSQLDLSLEQNVDQATQIFKPFYEDKGLMKDMAYTKNFMNNVSYGEGLKNAYDQKQRDQYWADGIAELQFKRQEFKEASIEDAMSMESVEYTPYVNTVAKAQEVAKEAGLSIESADLSKDGRWIVKTKNGEQLIEPLQKLFEARLGNDPGIQAVYKTQSYVNRKNYAESTAAQFGGDKNAAEMKYLENS